MATVTMAATTKGSPDGARVHTYEAGKSYDLPADLVRQFEVMGVLHGRKVGGPSEIKEHPPVDAPATVAIRASEVNSPISKPKAATRRTSNKRNKRK